VRVFTDMPKLGDTPVNGSAGFDMTKDANGVWTFTTPKLAPSYYQYWFVVDGLSTPDPQNTFVRPASGVYKSLVALPGKEA
jgi:enterochelin esterase family protein